MVQPGSIHALGAWGPGFESRLARQPSWPWETPAFPDTNRQQAAIRRSTRIKPSSEAQNPARKYSLSALLDTGLDNPKRPDLTAEAGPRRDDS